jgi:cytoskeletal protein RodZ
MPDIGTTLREARMRQRIDITDMEVRTKIRAKYLRALENEEWDLLPGPTFVKTFLRTYAEYLGLDPRLLVEEYRQRYERPSTQDLTPFKATRSARGRARRRRAASMGPLLVIAGCAAVLLGALWALGTWGDDDDGGTPPPPNSVRETEPTATPSEDQPREEQAERPPQRVRLQLVATAPVYVCVIDARGRQVVDEETLDASSPRRTYTSRSFRTNFGNSNVSMRVNGKTYRVAASTEAIGYELRPGRRPRRLPNAQRPDCSS